MNIDFKDRVYLITGSTSGIGQGIAKELLENGAKVIINYAHNEKNAQITKKLFARFEENVLFVKADVSNEEEVISMYDKIQQKFGKLDGVINNNSLVTESFNDNLLDYPNYTKPYEYRGMKVPEVLLRGHHQNIEKFRNDERIRLTKENRPDLLEVKDE